MKYILKIFLAFILSLLVLSIIALAYENTGIHIDCVGKGTDYKYKPHQFKSTMTEGFSWLFLDKNGYNNKETFFHIDMLIMGSSHIAALRIPQSKNMTALLNMMIPNKNTYSIATDGHTIYRNVDNIKYAIDIYDPKDCVILELDMIRLNMKEMKKVIEGKGKPIPSFDSGVVYYLQAVPAIKLLQSQTENWVKTSKTKSESKKSSNKGINEEYKKILSLFLEKANRECQNKNIDLIVFYHPKTQLKENGELDFHTDREYFDCFVQICQEKNITFVDMTDDFAKLYKEKHLLPRGFVNTEADKGHLNVSGHRVIAEKLAKVILSKKVEKL